MVHLTNDAVQKSGEYGKYETCNKLSFMDFDKYLDSIGYEDQFYGNIYPKIKKLIRDSFLWSHHKINSHYKFNGFELYGYDIMIDENLNTYLIEVNTNPWLETPWSLLSSVISSVLDHTFRITLDPIYPSPNSTSNKIKNKGIIDNLNSLSKFELIFDDRFDS